MTERVTDEEMEHWAMFPELYCRRCESGAGPLCDPCLDREIEDAEISAAMAEMYEDER